MGFQLNTALSFNASIPSNTNCRLNPSYERATQLPKLIALWPHEIADYSVDGTLRIIAKLRQALRGERRRGRAGHWSYDLNRHMALLEAIKAESVALDKLRKGYSLRTL